MQFRAGVLVAQIKAVLMAMGSETDEAELVGRHLVEADIIGQPGHGTALLETYVKQWRLGALKPGQHARLLKDDQTIIMFDGGMGFGRRVAGEALQAGIQRSRTHGVAVVTLINSHHLGRIGAYGEMAAQAGVLSIHFANVVGHRPAVAPFGAREGRLSTNPICLAAPGDPPIVLDMATSQVSFFKVHEYKRQGRPVPDGFLIDPAGEPTTDPAVMQHGPGRGAILPMGGAKGYGLSVFCEILGSALSGGRTIASYPVTDGTTINNMTSILLDPSRFAGTPWFDDEIHNLARYLRCSVPLHAGEPVRLPGERTHLYQNWSYATVVQVADKTAAALTALSSELLCA